MEVDREALLAAVKAANLIAEPGHKSPIFSKVWLIDDHVLGFNSTTTVFLMPFKLPSIGGIDGTLLAQLLTRADDDVVEINVTDKGQAQVKVGRSVTKLPVLDPIDLVYTLTKPPVLGDSMLEFEADMLGEDIELDGMLTVKDIGREQALEFASLNLHVTADKITMFSSDRNVINRTILKTASEVEGKFLVPLDFLRALKKLWSIFETGSCAIDGKRIVIAGEEDALYYTLLSKSEGDIPFANACGQLWDSGKVETDTLVPIPDELPEALKRAMLVKGEGKEDYVSIKVEGNKLTLIAEGRGTNFKETMDFEHPDVQTSVATQMLAKALQCVDRIYIGRRGVAVFGPKRYSRFIYGR